MSGEVFRCPTVAFTWDPQLECAEARVRRNSARQRSQRIRALRLWIRVPYARNAAERIRQRRTEEASRQKAEEQARLQEEELQRELAAEKGRLDAERKRWERETSFFARVGVKE